MASQTNNIYRQIRSGLVVIMFFSIVSVIGIWQMCTKEKEISLEENRYLTTLPGYSMEAWMMGQYGKDYENYLSDQFMFRQGSLWLHTNAERLFGKKQIGDIYFAENGYLMDVVKHTEYELALFERNVKETKAFLETQTEQNRNVSVMLVPEKEQVLNLVPKTCYVSDSDSLIRQAYENFGQRNCISVSAILSEHDREYIYYKSDHHWTIIGAYYAYEEWRNQRGLDKTAFDKEDFMIYSDDFYGTLESKTGVKVLPDLIYGFPEKLYQGWETAGDCVLFDKNKLATKDKYAVFFGGNTSRVEIHTANRNGKSILVIKDSFANCFVPFLSEEYETIVMVDLRYYYESIQEELQKESIGEILILYSLDGFAADHNIYKLNQ